MGVYIEESTTRNRGSMDENEAKKLILDGWWDRRMTVPQLKLYASNYCIDLGRATRRADILELIELVVPGDA